MVKLLKRLSLFVFVMIVIIWIYACSLIGVNEQVKSYLSELKIELAQQNYQANFFVISGRRWKIDNFILRKISGAASKSQHLNGQAIDIIILDINGDEKSDRKDVDIVYNILDKKIIKHQGGIGTYKNESGFFNRQMIHFDSRGTKARWHR